MAGSERAAPSCANCGSTLVAEYCAQCGQSQADTRRSAWRWLRDFLSEQFSLTARLPQTLWLLFTRPGYLSLEWSAGHRARYIDPIRLFLLVVVIMLAVITFWGVKTAGIAAEAAARNEALGRVTLDVAVRETARTAILITTVTIVPLLALVLKLVLLPRQTWYMDHLIFAIYFQTFSLFVLAIAWPLPLPEGPSLGLALLWIILYLIFALRRTYSLAGTAGGLRILAVLLLVVAEAFALGSRSAVSISRRLMEVDERVAAEMMAERVTESADRLFWRALAQLDQADTSVFQTVLDTAIGRHYDIDLRHRDYEHTYRSALLLYLSGEYTRALRLANEWVWRPSQQPLRLATLGVAFRAARDLGDTITAARYAREMVNFRADTNAPALDPRHQTQLSQSIAEARSFLGARPLTNY